jgi:ornithine cyclodeaminase/alanine dehydrogenase
MTGTQLLYLSRSDVEAVGLDMHTIIQLLERAFLEYGAGRAEMPAKIGIHTQPEAFLHAMPAYIPAMQAAGLKWVGGYPENHTHHLPYITGLLILNDPRTGLPYAVMDSTWITAYRTGGATLLSANRLARADSEVVGMIGCGVQGRTNLEALCTRFPVKRVYAYDISAPVCQRYCEEMSARLGVEALPVTDPRAAVVDCDLVVTAGPIRKKALATIQPGWLKPGAFASSVDFGSCWSLEALREIDLLTTDDVNQFNVYRGLGYFEDFPQPYTGLAELTVGSQPGRENDRQRALAINLGLALEDLAVAPTVYRLAREKGLGTPLNL